MIMHAVFCNYAPNEKTDYEISIYFELNNFVGKSAQLPGKMKKMRGTLFSRKFLANGQSLVHVIQFHKIVPQQPINYLIIY